MNAAGADLADLAGGRRFAGFGENPDLDQRRRTADGFRLALALFPMGGDQRTGFRLAEILDEMHMREGGFRARDQRRRRRGRAEHDLAQRSQPRCIERRMIEQHGNLRRHLPPVTQSY